MSKRHDHKLNDERGFTLTEVMVSMVILPISILGVISMFQYANAGLQDGSKSAQALAIAESRVEIKRAVPWEALLNDDLDADGISDLRMVDDGTQGDDVGGDGVFTAAAMQNGVQLTWTVQAIGGREPIQAGMVLIKARASYLVGTHPRVIETGTLRANPVYLGLH